MPDYFRVYARQEYLTPGAPETLAIIEDVVRPGEDTLLLEVASGKGEAAAHLASRHACRVVCVEPYDPFIHYAAAKFWHFNLRDLVSLVRADGRRLPVRGGAFDAAYCIGAPSLVGLGSALNELARAVRPRGRVIVSDVVWRSKPGDLGPEWGHWRGQPQVSEADYRTLLERAGLRVERVERHGLDAWEEYFRGMLETAAEAKTSQPADVFFADEVEAAVELDRRAAERLVDYATFVAVSGRA